MAKGGPAPSGGRGAGAAGAGRAVLCPVGAGALSCGHTPSPHGTTESAKVLFSKEWDQILAN